MEARHSATDNQNNQFLAIAPMQDGVVLTQHVRRDMEWSRHVLLYIRGKF
jgi:hypothetical protein